MTIRKQASEKEPDNSLITRNRSCHLRDRDVYLRLAFQDLSELWKIMESKIKTLEGKQACVHMLEKMLDDIETATYHAHMASPGRDTETLRSFSMEDELILDFLNSLRTSVRTVNYMISHSVLLQQLPSEDNDKSHRIREYVQKMNSFDEKASLDLLKQIRKRVKLFNNIMKIHKKLG